MPGGEGGLAAESFGPSGWKSGTQTRLSWASGLGFSVSGLMCCWAKGVWCKARVGCRVRVWRVISEV